RTGRRGGGDGRPDVRGDRGRGRRGHVAPCARGVRGRRGRPRGVRPVAGTGAASDAAAVAVPLPHGQRVRGHRVRVHGGLLRAALRNELVPAATPRPVRAGSWGHVRADDGGRRRVDPVHRPAVGAVRRAVPHCLRPAVDGGRAGGDRPTAWHGAGGTAVGADDPG